MAGYDPSNVENDVEGWSANKQPVGYAACRQALIGALKAERIKGYLHYDNSIDINGDPYSTFDIKESYVMTEGLADWLFEKGMRAGFFFPDSEPRREYLDLEHDRYAPKLAAAIRAWEAAGEDMKLRGTPKQRVEKWLRLHASEYGLTQKDGKPNESAIDAIARIANWKPEGGAPATPSKNEKPAGVQTMSRANIVRLKSFSATRSNDLDDDIPF